MQREIKFRIWNDKEIEVFTLDNDFDCIVGWLEKSQLMQFTGLKDKNAREIYEGDIVKQVHKSNINHNAYEYAMLGLISFQYNSFGVIHKLDICTQLIPAQCLSHQRNERKVSLHPTQGKDWFDYMVLFSQLEVIGNVFQNPELLILE